MSGARVPRTRVEHPEAAGAHRAAWILAALLALAYFPWTWSGRLSSFDGDSAVYALTAKAYAPYGAPDPLAAAFARRSLFPPLYPLVLAWTGGAADLHFAHAATTLCLLLAFVALYAWCVTLPLPRPLALACAALFAIAPGTYAQALLIHSESLYLAFAFAALALLAVASRTGRAAAWWGGALAVAAAMLTRSAGAALLPALAVALLAHRPPRWPLMLAAAVAPAMAWSVLHHPAMSYGGALAAMYGPRTAAEIAAMLAYQALSLAVGVAKVFAAAAAPGWLLAALGAVALAAAVWRLVRCRADAAYFFAYLALIVAWPWPDEAPRFAFVLAPLVPAYAAWGVAGLAARVPGRAAAGALRALVPAALALAIAPGFALALERRFDPATREHPGLAQQPEWYGVARDRALRQGTLQLGLAAAVRELAAQVPEGECVYTVKPAELALLGHRDGRLPPNGRTPDAEFDRFLRQGGCRYVLALALTSPAYGRPYYPLQRLGARVEIVDARPNGPGASRNFLALLGRIAD